MKLGMWWNTFICAWQHVLFLLERNTRNKAQFLDKQNKVCEYIINGKKGKTEIIEIFGLISGILIALVLNRKVRTK